MLRMHRHSLCNLFAANTVVASLLLACSGADGGGGGGQAGAPGPAGTAGSPLVMAGAGSGGTPGFAGSAGSAPVGGAVSGAPTAGAPVGGQAGVAGAGSSGAPSTAGASGAPASSGGPSASGSSGAPSGGSGGAGGMPAPTAGSGGGSTNPLLAKFSFFVASMKAMQQLANDEKGFGGDLKFGKADGLSGADEICRQTAELGMPGAGTKQWRAFLSTTTVNARDRIGKGPWYDVKGRLLANNLMDLLGAARPIGADPAIANDFPNERGEPNHYVGMSGYTPGMAVDNHDTLTGSKADGTLYAANATCMDWTSSAGNIGRPRLGHSWPRSQSTGNGAGWASDHDAGGCSPGINLIQNGAGTGTAVGSGGGYGGIYCFALTSQ